MASTSQLIKLDDARRLIDTHRDRILEQLHAVETHAKRFTETIAGSALPHDGLLPIRPITVYEPLATQSADPNAEVRYRTLNANASRRVAAEAFGDFEYEDQDARNQSKKCYGVAGAPSYVLDQARQFNHAKDDLKAAFQPISNLRVSTQKKERLESGEPKFREVSTMLLRETGRSSTNLLAVYRHVPMVDEPVHAIRFMLTHTRSVPRVAVNDLKEKASQIPEVLSVLSNTPGLLDDEYLLAPKRRYVRMRAKILYQRMESPTSKRRRQQIVSAELPILFPMLKSDSRWPELTGPGESKSKRGVPPSKMESEPLLHFGLQPYYRMKPKFRKP